ncbi:unnamed protein product [Vitrella brassicaformis CCMP3155]|uniref:T6SS Phospholipase effector Tle1-like catalytic domain-containing protein n=2 Tax=Vitrella brassicaformis TaxID=1169539 RepID=A0A0G4FIF4_VITBC|nr:unnamed protein product [Vitrella brassicaformis CCMP3155]|eukprot:CEM12892.1 unnamed protein product [Vitrella brassicaformis CCMP3155]
MRGTWECLPYPTLNTPEDVCRFARGPAQFQNVWFAGDHSDAGGGWMYEHEDGKLTGQKGGHRLSHIPLMFMLKHMEAHGALLKSSWPSSAVTQRVSSTSYYGSSVRNYVYDLTGDVHDQTATAGWEGQISQLKKLASIPLIGNGAARMAAVTRPRGLFDCAAKQHTSPVLHHSVLDRFHYLGELPKSLCCYGMKAAEQAEIRFERTGRDETTGESSYTISIGAAGANTSHPIERRFKVRFTKPVIPDLGVPFKYEDGTRYPLWKLPTCWDAHLREACCMTQQLDPVCGVDSLHKMLPEYMALEQSQGQQCQHETEAAREEIKARQDEMRAKLKSSLRQAAGQPVTPNKKSKRKSSRKDNKL